MSNSKWPLRYLAPVIGEMLRNFKSSLNPHVLHLQDVRAEGENIKTFTFRQHKKLSFQAGQYGIWWVPRFIWGKPVHLFTIAASPHEDTLQVSTRISQSAYKRKLNSLAVGSKVVVFGPVGAFTFGVQPPKQAILIAGGIGVTPMRSLAKYAYETKLDTSITLIHSAEGYYLYRDEFERYIKHCHFVHKDTFVDALRTAAIAAEANAVYYISGPPAFVTFAENQLRQLGKTKIKKDGFLGY